jgi:hypothetical protein
LIAYSWLSASGIHAEPVENFFSRLQEQQATFDAFQVNRRFFICNAEAANANLIPATEAAILAESAACVRGLLTKDAVFDNDGRIITGADGIVSTVIGILADVRQNVAFTLEAPLVLSFDPGRRPGTGEIVVSLAIELTHEITAPGPFGVVLGGQVAKFRTEVALRAVRPQEWLISSFVVRSLSFDSGLQLRFPTPFPYFPQRFQNQR